MLYFLLQKEKQKNLSTLYGNFYLLSLLMEISLNLQVLVVQALTDNLAIFHTALFSNTH